MEQAADEVERNAQCVHQFGEGPTQSVQHREEDARDLGLSRTGISTLGASHTRPRGRGGIEIEGESVGTDALRSQGKERAARRFGQLR